MTARVSTANRVQRYEISARIINADLTTILPGLTFRANRITARWKWNAQEKAWEFLAAKITGNRASGGAHVPGANAELYMTYTPASQPPRYVREFIREVEREYLPRGGAAPSTGKRRS